LAKQKADLAKQKAESEQKDIALKNEQLFRYALFGGLFIVLVFSYFLYNRFKVIRQQKLIIEERNRDIVDSLNYAQRIQKSILPTRAKFDETFNDYFVLYLPKDVVSGDFYWLETVHTTVKTELRDKVVVLAVVDCTGHGVPGALMSVVGNTLLNQTIKNPDINSPAQALDFLNVELPKNLKKENADDVVRDGMDLAMCAFDRKAGKLYFAGANNPLYLIRNNELLEFKGDKQGVSGADDITKTNFTNHVIDIRTDDCVYLFSDGYADQFGGEKDAVTKSGGKKFKYKRLKEYLLTICNLPMKRQEELLFAKTSEWRGEMEQTDDILVVGVRI
jgi:serine phosphatase RsbU (regulator of sigma subunit)